MLTPINVFNKLSNEARQKVLHIENQLFAKDCIIKDIDEMLNSTRDNEGML